MKRIVFCSDGTWSQRDARRPDQETNVGRMAGAIATRGRAGTAQMVQYDAGVGVEGNLLQRLWAGLTGAGLEKNVLDCYRFIRDNYEPGDEVYLFGFSRGAYTVRSAVGLIRKCGLLRAGDPDPLHAAYRFYRGKHHPDSDEAKAFRRANAQPQPQEVAFGGEGPALPADLDDGFTPPIHFVGVWDTVGALGIPWGPLRWVGAPRHAFADARLSRIVRHARHAVAIDERRLNFTPTLWMTKDRSPGQSVEQAWFPGSHSGVGGGGGHPPGLPDAAFLWMARCAEAKGLDFNPARLSDFRPDAGGPLVSSLTSIWTWLPHAWRPMGRAEAQPQAIKDVALDRRAANRLAYAPKNLVQAEGRMPVDKGPWH